MTSHHNVREVLLQIIEEQLPRDTMSATLQQGRVLEEAKSRLSGAGDEAILTQWSELFRTGLLAWGLNLNNPGPPFFHVTDPGRRAISTTARDPSNPAGYIRYLDSLVTLSPTTASYLREGLDCYVAGYSKAAAVMVGAAAESTILQLRDDIVAHIITQCEVPSSKLKDWRIKTIIQGLDLYISARFPNMDAKLKEEYEVTWSGFSHFIRMVRNEAGHPTSVEPISDENVHAALLMFPGLASLAQKLSGWATS